MEDYKQESLIDVNPAVRAEDMEKEIWRARVLYVTPEVICESYLKSHFVYDHISFR